MFGSMLYKEFFPTLLTRFCKPHGHEVGTGVFGEFGGIMVGWGRGGLRINDQTLLRSSISELVYVWALN